ncbi:MAG TPA: Os1348 family NHLP clan protein [Candidatus Polarisedimenticolia bacterium]|nr:Os1348 family NHLP clan protein [Candidatus Polarisedimenticolia bacterium]
MSQRNVEIVIGKLATDEEFRRRFEAGREETLLELTYTGMHLTPVELRALLDLDSGACRLFAKRLDARLQKVSLRKTAS